MRVDDAELSEIANRIVSDIADEAWEDARYAFSHQARFILQKAQSPIERLLALNCLNACFGYGNVLFQPTFPGGPFEGEVFAACQVKIGRYVADIAFELWGKKEAAYLVVECDGHDFHERTKEQAEHDRKRDRWMNANGIDVMRFTGREIVRDPRACVAEIESRLTAIYERLCAIVWRSTASGGSAEVSK